MALTFQEFLDKLEKFSVQLGSVYFDPKYKGMHFREATVEFFNAKYPSLYRSAKLIGVQAYRGNYDMPELQYEKIPTSSRFAPIMQIPLNKMINMLRDSKDVPLVGYKGGEYKLRPKDMLYVGRYSYVDDVYIHGVYSYIWYRDGHFPIIRLIALTVDDSGEGADGDEIYKDFGHENPAFKEVDWNYLGQE